MDDIFGNVEFKKVLRTAKHVAVLTGAGVSAESGVPTFRGTDGLWKKFRPEELATFEAFMANPALVWEWYNYRRELIKKVEPNPGHYALVEMAGYFDKFTLITQNVDGLHKQAGSAQVYELHGNIRRNRCLKCGATDYRDDYAKFPPLCNCGGNLRPDVVWFGEMLPEKELSESMAAARNCDLFFSVGTSAAVQPAASLPIIARQNGAYVVEINPEPSEISTICNLVLKGKSGEILPKIVTMIKEIKVSG